jgi:hypothetical protein
MSQPTMSNRPSVIASRASPRVVISATPESPGPLGARNSDPIRCSGWLARWRITDSAIVRPPGWRQSNGTGTLAHSNCGPHAVQLICCAPAPEAGDPPRVLASALTGTTIARNIKTSRAMTKLRCVRRESAPPTGVLEGIRGSSPARS